MIMDCVRISFALIDFCCSIDIHKFVIRESLLNHAVYLG